jgi:hypothetical protein
MDNLVTSSCAKYTPLESHLAHELHLQIVSLIGEHLNLVMLSDSWCFGVEANVNIACQGNRHLELFI